MSNYFGKGVKKCPSCGALNAVKTKKCNECREDLALLAQKKKDAHLAALVKKGGEMSLRNVTYALQTIERKMALLNGAGIDCLLLTFKRGKKRNTFRACPGSVRVANGLKRTNSLLKELFIDMLIDSEGNASTSDVNSENKTSSEVNIVENERLNCSDDEASCKMDEISVKDESDSCLEGEEESDEMNGMEEGGNEMNKSRGEIHTRN